MTRQSLRSWSPHPSHDCSVGLFPHLPCHVARMRIPLPLTSSKQQSKHPEDVCVCTVEFPEAFGSGSYFSNAGKSRVSTNLELTAVRTTMGTSHLSRETHAALRLWRAPSSQQTHHHFHLWPSRSSVSVLHPPIQTPCSSVNLLILAFLVLGWAAWIHRQSRWGLANQQDALC